MDRRIIMGDIEIEREGGQPSDGGQGDIGGDDAIALRDNQINSRIEQRLLRVQHVLRRALPHLRFVAHAPQSGFRPP